MTIDKDILICLIGKSGSGKSTIAKHYYNEGYNVIQSYTDRVKRHEDEWGHIFISTEDVESYRSNMIAHTFYNNHHYFATRNQYKNKGISFYVIDPYGVDNLISSVLDADLCFIYINADEAIRRERMIYRTLEDSNTKDPFKSIEENKKIEERIKYDKEAFSIVHCNYVVDNNEKIHKTIDKINHILSKIKCDNI